ncbi:DUF481 domain-containing protein [Carboxylicivirga caseinilyticus]|uniref:DUF481 domain-containing protein n=1 Tax=Carboxylicivirga caseinilyticus TaxID=3417572 RepID=UPI003D32CB54|nr:DUF481 domain-containing protein [Marinilabiliaceae bacterium A049]
MIRRFAAISFLFFVSIASIAQIVSIDKRRTKDPNKGFQGDVNLGVNYVHTNTDMLQVSSKFKLQYNDNDNTYLFSSDIGYSRVDNESNVNNGGFMFKYNYWVPDKIIIAEAFSQYSYNRVKSLKHRYIMGGGPRFNIADKDKFKLFVVAYTIYLNELFENDDYKRRKSLVKFSSMFSMDWQMSDNAKFSQTTYYEPDYSDPADFRIWSETSLSFSITKAFSFSLFVRMDYDNLVPPDVEPLFYTVNNSFTVKF